MAGTGFVDVELLWLWCTQSLVLVSVTGKTELGHETQARARGF